jgi:hypothetical protein
VLPAQELSPDISSEDNPLEKSLLLISDTINLIENIQNDNESLKVTLDNVSDMLKMQGRLLNEQAKTQAEQSAISERQATLLGRELRKGKILKWSLIVSVPVFTGLGMWAGWRLSK